MDLILLCHPNSLRGNIVPRARYGIALATADPNILVVHGLDHVWARPGQAGMGLEIYLVRRAGPGEAENQQARLGPGRAEISRPMWSAVSYQII